MKRESVRIDVVMGAPPVRQSLSYEKVCELARSLLTAGQYDAAVKLAEQLANSLPNDPETLLFAAEILLLGDSAGSAKNYTDRAAKLSGNSASVLLMKSRVAMNQRNGEEAISNLDQLIELDRENHQYYIERGDVQLALGNIQQARSDYNKAFELNNRDTRSLLPLSRLPGEEISQDKIHLLEKLIETNQLQQPEQMYAYFILANAYDKTGDIDKQFYNLRKGNELAGRHHKHDSRQHVEIVEKVAEYFSGDLLRGMPTPERNQQKIIFILGMPRSGSTLTEQIFCSHSNVITVGENNYMHQAVQTFLHINGSGLDFPAAVNRQNIAHLATIADNYLKSINGLRSETVIVDKTWGDYLYPGLISLVFPNAKFIHTKRHPVATCYGCYKQLFGSGLVPFAYDLKQLASQYRDVDRILTHWKTVLPDKFHTLQYESLIAEQELQTRRLLEFCHLEWEENCLNFHENKGVVNTASNIQVRRRLYTQAIDEWRKFEHFLGPLMELIEDEPEA